MHIRDGRIISLGAPADMPVGVRRIDGAGATLLPGLIDAHTHTRSVAELEQALRFGVTTVLDLFTRASDAPALRAAAALRSDVAGFFSAGILATAPAVTARRATRTSRRSADRRRRRRSVRRRSRQALTT